MPGYDRTGPVGRGPMTGGGFGRCGGARRGFFRSGAFWGAGRGGRPFGGGRGRVFGGGRGGWRGFGYYPYDTEPGLSDQSEADSLRAAAEDLKAELRAVEERLANIEKETT